MLQARNLDDLHVPAGERSRLSAMVSYLRAMFAASGNEREHLHAIFLGEQREYLGDRRISTGQFGSLRLRLRTLFADALAHDAAAVILAHNHPSGVCRPSSGDRAATARIREMAEALDIALLDHLIITPTSVYSMRAGGDL